MNATQRFLVEKMRIFEPCVVDITSNITSTIGKPTVKAKSVWNVKKQQQHPDITSPATCSSSCGAAQSELKVPTPSKNYYKREDQRQQLFQMMGQLTKQFDHIASQTDKALQHHSARETTPVAQPASPVAKNNYLNLVNKYFKNLDSHKRQKCLEEMLNALGDL